MEPSSATPDEIARKSHARILRRFQEVGQVDVARSLNLDPSTVSRFASEQCERACQILAQLGFKVVRSDRMTVKAHTYESVLNLLYSAFSDPKRLTDAMCDED